MICPGANSVRGVCSSHGKCVDMGELAPFSKTNGVPTPFTYGFTPNKKETWDVQSIKGCYCDEGWSGFDCSYRICPSGDDPTDNLPSAQVTEIQVIDCRLALSSTASQSTITPPTFILGFRGEETEAVSVHASADDVKEALETLETIGEVRVDFSYGVSTACPISGVFNEIKVYFLTEHGSLPLIELRLSPSLPILNSGNLYAIASDSSTRKIQDGTTIDEVCSNRGLCDTETGQCHCFHGWVSSNGMGGPGLTPDCGARDPFPFKQLRAKN